MTQMTPPEVFLVSFCGMLLTEEIFCRLIPFWTWYT
jgi:hypothetical protein